MTFDVMQMQNSDDSKLSVFSENAINTNDKKLQLSSARCTALVVS